MRPISVLPLLVATLCLVSLTADAKTKDVPKTTAAPAPVAATPERTTASFGDWILRCESVATTTKRVCEVAQIVTLQGQTNPIAQLALGKTSPTEAMRVTAVLPPNIAIPTKPQLLIAKPTASPVDLNWQSCTPAGCFASAEISDETISAFGAQTEPGRLTFKDATGRELALPLSFKGLSQAVAALTKEM